ncbi:hypothetical protein NJ76_27985, partial [Rhodococcus sp. IITR03]
AEAGCCEDPVRYEASGPRSPGGVAHHATAQRARRLEYSPDLDGRADPGEIVWTWVAYEEDPTQGKDRPVLVVGRDDSTLLGLMLSSNSDRDGHRDWLGIGSGPWDAENRPSWVRLDRVLDVPEDGIRREGAVLPRARFDQSRPGSAPISAGAEPGRAPNAGSQEARSPYRRPKRKV